MGTRRHPHAIWEPDRDSQGGRVPEDGAWAQRQVALDGALRCHL